jgi:hypothetical protein
MKAYWNNPAAAIKEPTSNQLIRGGLCAAAKMELRHMSALCMPLNLAKLPGFLSKK